MMKVITPWLFKGDAKLEDACHNVITTDIQNLKQQPVWITRKPLEITWANTLNKPLSYE